MSSRIVFPLTLVIAFVGTIWLVFFMDLLLCDGALKSLGIKPREASGLAGIAISPVLHGSLHHLISNTIPLLVLPILLWISEGKSKLIFIFVVGILGSGAFTWLFSSADLIIGASGLVFVLVGYLLTDCFLNPCKKSVPIGIVTFFLYGSSVFSLYHFAPHISLAAHAGGLITGAILAKCIGGRGINGQ